MNNSRNTIINMNGKIIPISEAKVSVFDRSFVFGDSLYEVVRTYNGRPFRLKDHMIRMQKSAALCQMQLAHPVEYYERAVLESIEAFRAQPGRQNEEVYQRIIVSRGAGKTGFNLKNIEEGETCVIITEPITAFSSGTFEAGTKLRISDRKRNHPQALDPAAKTGNYMNCMLAYLSAVDEGYDDAIMVDQTGFLTEGTTFNLFYVRRGIVATPPLGVGILEGITRKVVMNCCIELGIPCREVRFPKEYLYDADEVFITGSVKEILPVYQLDKHKIGQKPGPITTQLRNALVEVMNRETQA